MWTRLLYFEMALFSIVIRRGEYNEKQFFFLHFIHYINITMTYYIHR